MIDSGEIRLGNYVESKISGCNKIDKGVIEVDASAMMYLFDVDDDWHMLNPIPITEKWLLDFGFKKDSYGAFSKDGFVIFFENNEDANTSFIGTHIHGILYVHKLQNLYFALTGEELTLKTQHMENEIRVTRVIISKIERRGAGTEGDPVRQITRVYDLDGNFIAEYDPFMYDKCSGKPKIQIKKP